MIVITGAQGMLGKALVAECEARDLPHLGLGHREIDITVPTQVHDLGQLEDHSVIINAAGLRPGADPITMMQVNAVGPWVLADFCVRNDWRLIHVSTDCVFSSTESGPRPRRFTDRTCPDSIYGLSKAAGEPTSIVPNRLLTTVRTSFVGPDHGLWRFVADADKDATLTGWTGAWWSGSTVEAVATRLINMADGPTLYGRTLHLATAVPITKFEVLELLRDHVGRPDIKIVPAAKRIDRSLVEDLTLPPLKDALAALKEARYELAQG